MSIYEACRHRQTALQDSAALCNTIIGDLLREQSAMQEGGLLERTAVIQATTNVLRNFDTTAATVYAAYHK